jgi:molybdate transport system regulatory protein
MSARNPPSVRVRLDFSADRSVGPGKIDLLEKIESSGSLSAAARALGLSYRRAWLLLDDLNRSFTGPVATTSKGGSNGGGAVLTALGRRLIDDYRDVEHAATLAARRRFRTMLPDGATGGATTAALRTSVRRPILRRVRPR